MGTTSKIDGPVNRCRPAVGIGTGEQPADLGGLKILGPGMDPAKRVADAAVRRLALDVAGDLLMSTADSIARITGLSREDMALLLTGVRDQFCEVVYPAPLG